MSRLWSARPDVVFHGAARGADIMAEAYFVGLWSVTTGNVRVVRCPANWSLGKRAGIVRNEQMLKQALELADEVQTEVFCAAFPQKGSVGTWDMIRRCCDRGVRTLIWPG